VEGKKETEEKKSEMIATFQKSPPKSFAVSESGLTMAAAKRPTNTLTFIELIPRFNQKGRPEQCPI